MKGFIILFQGGKSLVPVYVVVLAIPVLFETIPKLRERAWLQIVAAAVMMLCLPLTYWMAKSVGASTAGTNQTEASDLPKVRFKTNCGTFSGRLLYSKGGTFYVHDAAIPPNTKDATSPPNTNPEGVCLKLAPVEKLHFVTIYQAQDVHGLEIKEWQSKGE